MAEWIVAGTTIVLLIAAIIGYFIRETHWKTVQAARDEALDKKIEERDATRNGKIDALKDTVTLEIGTLAKGILRIETILGNGHGLIHDVRFLEKCIDVNAQKADGEFKEIRTRQSAMQHEIDEIKKS
jgi:hypothetical protein